jgi:hypothetical protein
VFWGATRVASDQTNDRGVEHGCEEKGQEGHEEEEGFQEEEEISQIDLGQSDAHGYILILIQDVSDGKGKGRGLPKGYRGQAR